MKKRTLVLGLAALLALAMVFTGCGNGSSSTTNVYPGVTGDNLGPVVATLTAAEEAFAKGYTPRLSVGGCYHHRRRVRRHGRRA
jgi:hypothetical protein